MQENPHKEGGWRFEDLETGEWIFLTISQSERLTENESTKIIYQQR